MWGEAFSVPGGMVVVVHIVGFVGEGPGIGEWLGQPPWVEVGVTGTLDISQRKIQQYIAMPKCVKVQRDPLQNVHVSPVWFQAWVVSCGGGWCVSRIV